MTDFLNALTAFAQTQSVWVYVFIFLGKMLEVTTSTLRIVLINRGIRSLGSLLAVVEITMWLIITSTVLTGFQSDPFKIVVYAVAFGLGNFLGSWLDEKLAFGLSSIQVVVPDLTSAHILSATLREKGFGITTMDVHGIENESRYMLLMMIQRKHLHEALELITDSCDKAVVTVTDVKVQKGGYLRGSSSRHISFPLRKAKKTK
ncbi:MAG TPA: DUF5698 domain-containing protein [Feifaniaceae bacterium]|nr:DUF5698 domain-containing protein [Feifaniaceae bacterium]